MAQLVVDAAAAGGDPAPGTVVRVALTDADGNPVAGRTTDEVITQVTAARLDHAGRVTFQLVPNADITPANTYYTVTIGQGRNADAFLIEKGAGDENLVDCEAFTPAALGSAATLGSLADVDVAAVTDGDALVYDAGSDTWVPGAGGGGGTPTGPAGGVLSGTYPNPSFAADMATQAELDAAVSALAAVYQPLDSDLTAIAALITTAFGRGLLELANAAAARTALGLGTASTAAAGDFQPVDSDLTAIAALTTTAFGRSLLELANAGAARTALGLGSLAVLSTITSSEITDGTIVNGDISASAAIALSKLATDPLARANHTGTQAGSTVDAATDAARGTVPLRPVPVAAYTPTSTFPDDAVKQAPILVTVRAPIARVQNAVLDEPTPAPAAEQSLGSAVAANPHPIGSESVAYVAAPPAGVTARVASVPVVVCAAVASSAPSSRRVSAGTTVCPAIGYAEVTVASTAMSAGDWFAWAADNTAVALAVVLSGTVSVVAGLTASQATAFPLPATPTPGIGGRNHLLMGY